MSINAATPARPPSPVVLSILVPAFNEGERLQRVLKEALAVAYPVPVEIVVVDDGSTDSTPSLLATVDDTRVVAVRHTRNQGKGAAIRTAVGHASGAYLVVLDADLEYDPVSILDLLRPVLQGHTRVVFGNRHFHAHTAYSFWYVMGNKALTLAANVLFNAYIGDLETGLKLMPVALYRALDVRSRGFGMEAEITGKLLRNGIRPYDVPVAYRARSRADGKKITWRDGVAALAILLRERMRRRRVEFAPLGAVPPARSAPPGSPRADREPSLAGAGGGAQAFPPVKEELVDNTATDGERPSGDR